MKLEAGITLFQTEDAYSVILSNQGDMLGVGNDSIYQGADMPFSTEFSIYSGSEKQELTDIKVVSITPTTDKIVVNAALTGIVTIKVKEGADFTHNGGEFKIKLAGTCYGLTKNHADNPTYLAAEYNLQGVPEAADGVSYQLSLSRTYIPKDGHGDIKDAPLSLTVNVISAKSNGELSVLTAADMQTLGISLDYAVDGAAQGSKQKSPLTISGIGTSIKPSKALTIRLWSGSKQIDTQDCFVVQDGTNSVRVDLDNENDSILYNGQGVKASADVVSNIRVFDGATDVTSKCTLSIDKTGCTATLSGTKITVSGIDSNVSNAEVKAKATYLNNTYTSIFTIARKNNSDKYDLAITPNDIAYNTTTQVASASSIVVKVYRTYIGTDGAVKTDLCNTLPTGLSLKENGTAVTYSSGNYTCSTIDFANRDDYRYELLNGTAVEDYETIPINKVANGLSLTSVVNYYQWGTSGTSAPTGTWTQTNIPTHVSGTDYLWNYEVCYNNKSEAITTSGESCIGYFPKGIVELFERYITNNSSSAPTAPSLSADKKTINYGDWKATPDATTNSNRYVWNVEITKYTDGTYSIGKPHCAGVQGEAGVTPTIGDNGNWFIGSTDTGRTSKGDNGFSPQLGDNGNWWEYDAAKGKYTDTGIKAHGTDAKSPYVNSSGNWMLWDDSKQQYVDSGKTSKGDSGNSPYIGSDGYWYEYDDATKQYKKTSIKAQGASAYEVWLKSNPGKTEADYLASLVGAQGLSAYEVYKKGGGTLSESQWLESLDGKPGASAYDLYKAGGGTKSEADWLDSLKGATGTSITGVEEQYCYGSDTTPNDSWGTTVITPKNESGKYYVWNREKITYSSGGTSYTTAHLTGKYVQDGDTGRGISSYTEKYAVTSSTTVPTSFPYDKISDAIAKITDTDRYLWNQETITYTKGTPATESSVRLISIKGEKGSDSTVPGPTGPTGCAVRIFQYVAGTTYYNDSGASSPRSGESNRWIDVVQRKGNDGKMHAYMVTAVSGQSTSKNTQPFVSATDDKPNDGWQSAQYQPILATDVLLADNAYIKMTQGNALHLQCNGSTPHFTAGAAGGTESNGTHSGYAFWAGTNTTGIPTDAQKADAPFRVDHEGNCTMTKLTATNANVSGKITTDDISATGGTIGGFTISDSSISNNGKISLNKDGAATIGGLLVDSSGNTEISGTLKSAGLLHNIRTETTYIVQLLATDDIVISTSSSSAQKRVDFILPAPDECKGKHIWLRTPHKYQYIYCYVESTGYNIYDASGVTDGKTGYEMDSHASSFVSDGSCWYEMSNIGES